MTRDESQVPDNDQESTSPAIEKEHHIDCSTECPSYYDCTLHGNNECTGYHVSLVAKYLLT